MRNLEPHLWNKFGVITVRFSLEEGWTMSVFRQAVVCLLLALPAIAQSQAFEKITVNRDGSGDARNMRMQVLPNGHLIASAIPVLLLLRFAYDVPMNPSARLSGVPEWAIRERYDVEAKAVVNAVPAGLSETAVRARVQRMVRGLLADRFGLVMRVDHKTMTVYALNVASGGPKLHQSTIAEKDCTFDTGTSESCHNFIGGMGHPLHAKAITIDDLAHYIENWTDLPVVNGTGISGLFAVETEGWTAMRLPPPPPDNTPAVRPSGDSEMSGRARPTIFTVLRELGLELQKQQATVPVYAIEHIERPAAN